MADTILNIIDESSKLSIIDDKGVVTNLSIINESIGLVEIAEQGQQGQQGQDGLDGRDGRDGIDGYTPVKGVDYFDGATGQAGADGYTPIKNVDYFDGINGQDGKDGKDGLTTSVNNIQHVNGNITLTKSDIGLSNVDNTSDANKPISTATQIALDASAKRQSLIRSTGLMYGGDLSVNADNTKFDIASGGGYIVDNFTDSENPTSTLITWDSHTEIETPYLLIESTTYVYINLLGELVLSNSYPTHEEMRDLIYVGYLTHEGSVITEGILEPIVSTALALQIQDFFISFGAFNIKGNEFYNTSNNLNINRSAGTTFSANANYAINKKIPHIITTELESVVNIHYYYRDVDGEWVNNEPLTTNINPNQYDTGNGLATVPNGKWTVQLLSYYAQTNSNDFQYGQKVYDTYAEAITDLKSPVQISPYNEYNTFRGWLIVQQGCTDLSDETKAMFVNAGKLGLFDVASGGGTGGEVNTASNIGTSGIGLWKDKVGVDLRFKKLNIGSDKVILTDNIVNNEVVIDVDINNIKTALNLTKSDVGLENVSGTNTGDETTATIKTKLGISTLSGSNTGDQDLSGLVLKTTTVNGHALTENINITKTDVGLGNVVNSDTTTTANITDSTDKRFTSDTEKSAITHLNRSAIDKVIDTGDGSTFLANDGTYKTIEASSGGVSAEDARKIAIAMAIALG